MDRIDLKRYLEREKIDAELISTGTSVHTAEAAAERLNVDESQIVKSLVFMVDGEPVMLIVPGDREVDRERAKSVLGVEEIRLAGKEEVEEATGYSIGEVPPVGVDIETVIYEELMERDEVYGGGGSDRYLLKISPQEIKEHVQAKVEPL